MHGTLDSVFRVEWRPLHELGPIAADWRDLAAHSLEPNVFYEPAFALAAQPAFGQGVGAGLVWSRGRSERLIGVFPMRIERWRYGLPLPVLTGWTHPYAPLGAPLVDSSTGAIVIAAWFDHVCGQSALPRLMLLPYFPDEGPLARAFDEALSHRNGRSKSFDRHQRALLAPDEPEEERGPEAEWASYVERTVGHKKLKELRRQARRLGETGALTITEEREPAAVAAALNDFLTLEAAGWKGRAGTAARSSAATCTFIEEAVSHLAADGKARVARLSIDGRAIAALIVLTSGDGAWCWKIAYDENAARFSPGVQLLVSATESLLHDEAIAFADSCATPDHPMIDHIWRERLTLADRLIDLGGGGPRFMMARMLESARRKGIAVAKQAKATLRR